MKGRFCFIILLFILLSGINLTYAATIVLPEAFKKEAALLKQKDSLAQWLYLRMDFCAQDPAARLTYLMHTNQEVWRNIKSPLEHEAWLDLLVYQSYYQLFAGNILQSVAHYEKAYDYYTRHPSASFDVAQYILNPLGNNYTRLGDYDRAIFIQQKNLAVALAKKDSSLIASVYSNMAISYKSKGNSTEAEKTVYQGLHYADKKPAIYGLLQNTLADIKNDQGNYAEAEKSALVAIRILSKEKATSNRWYWLLSAYTLAGNINHNRKAYNKALSNYKQALSILNNNFKGTRKRERATVLTDFGKVYLQQGNDKKALQFFNEALQVLIPTYNQHASFTEINAGLFGENKLQDALYGRAKSFLALNNKQLALDNLLLALNTGDKLRTEFSDVNTRQKYQKNSKQLAETAIEIAFALWQQTGMQKYGRILLSIAERTKARTLQDAIQNNRQYYSLKNTNPLFKKRLQLERALSYYERQLLLDKAANKQLTANKNEVLYRLAAINKQIRNKYPAWSIQDNYEQASMDKLLAEVPATYTVLAFFVGRQNSYGIKISNKSISKIIRIENAGLLKTSVKTYVSNYFTKGASAMINNPKDFFFSSHHLYQQILASLLQQETKQQVLIIPDDALGYLSFEGLITSPGYSRNLTKWPFLIKKYMISYAYSLQSWIRPSLDNSKGIQSFSGFFITHSGITGHEIPAVALEFKSVKHLVDGTFYKDDRATAANFNQALNNADVLHISTHSFLYGAQSEPALQLSNGKYFLFELSAQPRVPGLVILSSCRTADGMMAQGEGVLSLSRGFAAAGTKGTIAGLWNVNDKATSDLMLSFYKNLPNGSDVATALHNTKLSWLNKPHKNNFMLLPYYWNSLVYMGKPQSIQLAEATDYFYVIAVVCTILFILIGVFILKTKNKKLIKNENS